MLLTVNSDYTPPRYEIKFANTFANILSRFVWFSVVLSGLVWYLFVRKFWFHE